KETLIYYLFYRRVEKILDQEKPHFIICTHFFCSITMARLKRSGYPIPLCVVITDFHVHGVWVHPEVDMYFVANRVVAEHLVRMGIQKEKIFVTGMPIRSDFWKPRDKYRIRRQLRLKNLPTILVMGGG